MNILNKLINHIHIKIVEYRVFKKIREEELKFLKERRYEEQAFDEYLKRREGN